MLRAFAPHSTQPRRSFRGALLLVALGGCSVKHPTADLVSGKQLFVAKCGCLPHARHAGTTGTVGPNLDDAFRQDRADGVKSTSIQGLVDYWIQYPNTQGVMPAKLFTGQEAQDVAALRGRASPRVPGQDTGALATAVQPSPRSRRSSRTAWSRSTPIRPAS